MTTPNNTPTPSFGGHRFTGITPVYFNADEIGGGGDLAPEVDPAEPAEVEPEVTPEVDPAEPAEVEPEVDETVDPDDGTIPEALRPYIKELREEAASRRVASKVFDDAFTGYDDDERAAFLEIAQGLASDDPAVMRSTAERLQEIAKTVLGNEPDDDPNRPLTRADLARIDAEKVQAAEAEQAKAAEEAGITAVIKEATDLGYSEQSPAYANLMWRAMHETNGDLTKAHEAIQAEKQAHIDEFVNSVRDGKEKWPVRATPNTGGVVADDPTGAPPNSWKASRAASEARNRAAFGS